MFLIIISVNVRSQFSFIARPWQGCSFDYYAAASASVVVSPYSMPFGVFFFSSTNINSCRLCCSLDFSKGPKTDGCGSSYCSYSCFCCFCSTVRATRVELQKIPQLIIIYEIWLQPTSRRFLRELDEVPGGNNLHYILQCLCVPALVTRVWTRKVCWVAIECSQNDGSKTQYYVVILDRLQGRSGGLEQAPESRIRDLLTGTCFPGCSSFV